MILALCAAASLRDFVNLLPTWIAAAKEGQHARESFDWIALVTAISAGAAAYGLWGRRRWARTPFAIFLVASLATLVLVTWFGLGDSGTGRAWLRAGLVWLLALALAGALMKYVWRHT